MNETHPLCDLINNNFYWISMNIFWFSIIIYLLYLSIINLIVGIKYISFAKECKNNQSYLEAKFLKITVMD